MNCAVESLFAKKLPTRETFRLRWRLRHPWWAVACWLLSLGCRPTTPPTRSPTRQGLSETQATRSSAPAHVGTFDTILPDAASPFTAAAPVTHGQGFVRRTYVAGEKRIEITIARFGKDPGAFDHWVAGSASYPQAHLSLPTSQANGFFSCASELTDAPCDLHIQLRSGFHIEVMGNGRVPRRDLDRFMAQVGLTDLSDPADPTFIAL